MTAAPRTTSTQGRRFAALPLAAALAKKLPGCGFRVLIAICASADQFGCAWPGVDEISRRTGIDRRKVPALVKRLEAAALIRVERRPGRGSVYAVNYVVEAPSQLSPDQGTVPMQSTVPQAGDTTERSLSPDKGTGVPRLGSKLSPDQGTKQINEQTNEERKKHTPSLSLGERVASMPALRVVVREGQAETAAESVGDNPPKPASPETAERAPRAAKGAAQHPAEIEAAFAEFWSDYPRKVGKDAALRKYAAALKGGASTAEILMGARRYAEACRNIENPRFVAHPKTWLGDGRWTDEPELKAVPKFKSPFLADLHAAAIGGRPEGLSGVAAALWDTQHAGDDGFGPHDGVTLDLEAEPTTDGRAA